MAVIEIELEIDAPPEICFDLARSVDAHVASAAASEERAVAGVTSGLLNLGDEVTWRARHFGVKMELTSRITRFDRPRYFRDEMVRGAFTRLSHDHLFDAISAGTRMRDVFEFVAPWGAIGRVAAHVVLARHFRRFLEDRAQVLKRLAESNDATRYLDPA
jgi:ligand-binding SRPBCC domain-containing protein